MGQLASRAAGRLCWRQQQQQPALAVMTSLHTATSRLYKPRQPLARPLSNAGSYLTRQHLLRETPSLSG